jgi:hypothetical protein
MGRAGTIGGRFIERAARLIATPWSAAIGMIILVDLILDFVPAAGALASTAVQWRGEAPARVDCATLNQTPQVNVSSLVPHGDHGSYRSPAVGRVRPTHRPKDLLAPQRRARRQASMSAISTAPHGRTGGLTSRRQDRNEALATTSHEHDGLDRADAVAFERRLGDWLFHDPSAVAAARRTAEQLFDVTRRLHTELCPETTPERVEQIFFSDKLINPGQVGRGVVTLPELLREGNLRMVMTALLNAIHDSKDPLTLEMAIQELLKRPAWEEIAERAGFDVVRLHALKEMVDAGHGVFAVPALGSHSPDARDAVTECIASQAARWRRTPADSETYRWTAQEFADRGIALHSLEIAAQHRAAPSQPVDDPRARLCWLSGRALFGLNTEAPWFRTVSVKRGFPVTTGISGCAARLHSVFIWIRPQGVSEHEFTRALIGWILPSDHHSLYEVIRGIQIAAPHFFHEPGNGFTHASDLYRRAPELRLTNREAPLTQPSTGTRSG